MCMTEKMHRELQLHAEVRWSVMGKSEAVASEGGMGERWGKNRGIMTPRRFNRTCQGNLALQGSAARAYTTATIAG